MLRREGARRSVVKIEKYITLGMPTLVQRHYDTRELGELHMEAETVGGRLSRRAVVGGLTGLGAAAAGLALLQTGARGRALLWSDPPQIGYLGAGSQESDGAWHLALVDGLAGQGYVDGKNIHI